MRSMSGATIGDVHDELYIDDKLYKKIFVCAGTNDCSKSDMTIEVVTENFSTLLQGVIPDRREPYRRVPLGRVHLDERRLDEVQ